MFWVCGVRMGWGRCVVLRIVFVLLMVSYSFVMVVGLGFKFWIVELVFVLRLGRGSLSL